jgi:hypothetical protein
MTVTKPRRPVAIALVRIPFPATTLKENEFGEYQSMEYFGYLACFVSSAMWPEASNPVKVPAVNRL